MRADSDDPLTRALAPPEDETAEARDARLRAEAEARRVSDAIDEQLGRERAALKKRKLMKMLLLGQSESGKSTTLKNMQMTYTPKAWAHERDGWKAVIQLNLIRTVLALVDALTLVLAAPASNPSNPSTPPSHSTPLPLPLNSSPPSPTSDDAHPLAPPALSTDRRTALLKLKLRLAPLRQVEADLKTRLGAGTDEVGTSDDAEDNMMMATPFDEATYARQGSFRGDVVVRSHRAWKDLALGNNNNSSARPMSPDGGGERDCTSEVLAGCAEDMCALWEDDAVREVVRQRRVLSALGDSAEYFLRHIGRIATRGYEPSDGDILRARIRTLGVQEYYLKFEVGNERDVGKEWCIYDVGGSRTSRAAWLPYFSDVHAILFLAPISAFDERLVEDRRVNRLEDTFLLWNSIAKSELLKGCILILFMNKCDVLDEKLKAGVRVNRYMTSYGARPNDVATFSSYLKVKFRELLQAGIPDAQRPFYCFTTSVVDAEATAKTLASVRDGVLQSYLQKASLVV